MPLRRRGSDHYELILAQTDAGHLGQDTATVIGDIDQVDPADLWQTTGCETAQRLSGAFPL